MNYNLYLLSTIIQTTYKLNMFDILVQKTILENCSEIIGKSEMKKLKKEYQRILGNNSDNSNNIDLEKFSYLLKSKLRKKTADQIISDAVNNSVFLEKINKEYWLSTEDMSICLTILNSYGDSHKKIILDSLVDVENHTCNTVKQLKLPQTSGYRKVKELIQDGLIAVNDVTHIKTDAGRKSTVYESLCSGVIIWMTHSDSMKVSIQVKPKFLKDSFVYGMLKK